jgi:hypothetical protein
MAKIKKLVKDQSNKAKRIRLEKRIEETEKLLKKLKTDLLFMDFLS